MNLNKFWYCSPSWLNYLLIPISGLFCFISFIRKSYYLNIYHKFHKNPSPPIIVVGNISVGGTGKTPFVIWLVQLLKQQKYKPGIISRGYQGKASTWPQQVYHNSDPRLVGDEAVLLAQNCQCPLFVGPNRNISVQHLITSSEVNIIISDDGLQHYALDRQLEIAIIDGKRQHGNGLCLPAGPLREPVSRLKNVDFIIVNSPQKNEHNFVMQLTYQNVINLKNSQLSLELSHLKEKKVHAVAAIGHPERFFNLLKSNDITIIPHIFPDHYYFQEGELDFNDHYPVVMTEKDAVKYQQYATDSHWYLPIKVKLDDPFTHFFLKKVESFYG